MEQEKKQPDVRLIGLDLDGNRKSKIGYSRVFNTD